MEKVGSNSIENRIHDEFKSVFRILIALLNRSVPTLEMRFRVVSDKAHKC